MKGPLIAPSMLSADFSRFGEELRSVEQSGADLIHLDVMDGAFVPSITFGEKLVADLRPLTALPLDVHVMVERPEAKIDSFARAGADWLTFHLEASVHAHRLAMDIRKAGMKAGISIVPSTPVSALLPLLEAVDLILVMTVDPGAGGQPMIASCVEKAAQLAREREGRGLEFLISVDGGVNAENASRLGAADILVAGSAVFGAQDRALAIRTIREAGAIARGS